MRPEQGGEGESEWMWKEGRRKGKQRRRMSVNSFLSGILIPAGFTAPDAF